MAWRSGGASEPCSRGAGAPASKARLSAAESALLAGLQAREDAVEAVDVARQEVEYQWIEHQIAAVALSPVEPSATISIRQAQLDLIERHLGALSERARAIRDSGRRARVSRAARSAGGKLRAAHERLHAVEDRRLLEEAARLLGPVQPARERHQAVPAIAALDAPDYNVTFLRIGSVVKECAEHQLRIETEAEAAAEVEALCEAELVGGASRHRSSPGIHR